MTPVSIRIVTSRIWLVRPVVWTKQLFLALVVSQLFNDKQSVRYHFLPLRTGIAAAIKKEEVRGDLHP